MGYYFPDMPCSHSGLKWFHTLWAKTVIIVDFDFELVDILNKECAIGIHILFDKHISLFKDIRLLYKSKKKNDRS